MVMIPQNNQKRRTGVGSQLEQQMYELASIARAFSPDSVSGFTPQNVGGIVTSPGFSQWGSQNIDPRQVIGTPGFFTELSGVVGETKKLTGAAATIARQEQSKEDRRKAQQRQDEADARREEEDARRAENEAREAREENDEALLHNLEVANFEYFDRLNTEALEILTRKAESGELYLPPGYLDALLEGKAYLSDLTDTQRYAIIRGVSEEVAARMLEDNPEAFQTALDSAETDPLLSAAFSLSKQRAFIEERYRELQPQLQSVKGQRSLELEMARMEILTGRLGSTQNNFAVFLEGLIDRLDSNPQFSEVDRDLVVRGVVEEFYKNNPDAQANHEFTASINSLVEGKVSSINRDQAAIIKQGIADLETEQVGQSLIARVEEMRISGDLTPEQMVELGIYEQKEDGTIDVDTPNFAAYLDYLTDMLMGAYPASPEGLDDEALKEILKALPSKYREGVTVDEKTGEIDYGSPQSIAQMTRNAVKKYLSPILVQQMNTRTENSALSTNVQMVRTIEAHGADIASSDADWLTILKQDVSRMRVNYTNPEITARQTEARIGAIHNAISSRAQNLWSQLAGDASLTPKDRVTQYLAFINGDALAYLVDIKYAGQFTGTDANQEEQKERFMKQERKRLFQEHLQTITAGEKANFGKVLEHRFSDGDVSDDIITNYEDAQGNLQAVTSEVIHHGNLIEMVGTINDLRTAMGYSPEIDDKVSFNFELKDGSLLPQNLIINHDLTKLVSPIDTPDMEIRAEMAKDGVEDALIAWRVIGTVEGTFETYVRYIEVTEGSPAYDLVREGLEQAQNVIRDFREQTNAVGTGGGSRSIGSGRTISADDANGLADTLFTSYRVIDSTGRVLETTPDLETTDPEQYAEIIANRTQADADYIVAHNLLRRALSNQSTEMTPSMFDAARIAYDNRELNASFEFASIVASLPDKQRGRIYSALAEGDEKDRKFGHFLRAYVNRLTSDMNVAAALTRIADPNVTPEPTDILAMRELIIGIDPAVQTGPFYDEADAEAINQMRIASAPNKHKAIMDILTDPTTATEGVSVGQAVYPNVDEARNRLSRFNKQYRPFIDNLAVEIFNSFAENLPLDDRGKLIEVENWEDLYTHPLFDTEEMRELFTNSVAHLLTQVSFPIEDESIIPIWAAEQAMILREQYTFRPDAQGQVDMVKDPNGYAQTPAQLPPQTVLTNGDYLRLQLASTPITPTQDLRGLYTPIENEDGTTSIPEYDQVHTTLEDIIIDGNPEVINTAIHSLYIGIQEAHRINNVVDRESLMYADSVHSTQWYGHPYIIGFMEDYEALISAEEPPSPELIASELAPYLHALAFGGGNAEYWTSQEPGELVHGSVSAYYLTEEAGDEPWVAYVEDVRNLTSHLSSGSTDPYTGRSPFIEDIPTLFIPGKLNRQTGEWETSPKDVARTSNYGNTWADATNTAVSITGEVDLPPAFYQLLSHPEATMLDVVLWSMNYARPDLDPDDLLEAQMGHIQYEEGILPITADSWGATIAGNNSRLMAGWSHHQGSIPDYVWKGLMNGLPISEMYIQGHGINRATSKDMTMQRMNQAMEVHWTEDGEPALRPIGGRTSGYPLFTLNTRLIDPSFLLDVDGSPEAYHQVPLHFYMTDIREDDMGTIGIGRSGWQPYTNRQQHVNLSLPESITNPQTDAEQRLSRNFFSGNITLDIAGHINNPDIAVREVTKMGGYPKVTPERAPDGKLYLLKWDKERKSPALIVIPEGKQWNDMNIRLPGLSHARKAIRRWFFGDQNQHAGYIYRPLPYRSLQDGDQFGLWADYLPLNEMYPSLTQFEFDRD